MTNPTCPYCGQTRTRLMHRIFEKEVYLCEDCLKSFSIEFNVRESFPTARRA